MKVDILDEQIDAIVIAEMKENIEDVTKYGNIFDEEEKEVYIEAFKKVLKFYGGEL